MKKLLYRALQIFDAKSHSNVHQNPSSQPDEIFYGPSESPTSMSSPGHISSIPMGHRFQQNFRPPHHSIPPPRHLRHGSHGFPGLNSAFGEALTEYSLASLDELRSILTLHCPELTPDLEKILSEGASSATLVVDLLQIDEATARLQRIREMLIWANACELLVVLPLPPHITNHLARHINNDLLLTASNHLPPHLHDWPCSHIDDIMPEHLLECLSSTKAIVVEGIYQNGTLMLPTNVIKLLFIIKPHYPDLKLFVHNMPHLPRGIEFAKLTANYQIYTI